MKKRTIVKGYTKSMQWFDAVASRTSGVLDNSNSREAIANRQIREHNYERKRAKYARLSGIGASECARRSRAYA